MTTELKPGTCVSFKNFNDATHLNGKPGLIKKKLENGSYRVMFNSKNDIQVKHENLNVVEQCPNTPQETDGSAFLMWPDTPRSEFPSLQWIESQELNRICTEYLVSMGANVVKGLTKDKKKRSEDCEKLSECLKKLLGWKNPAQLRLHTLEPSSEILLLETLEDLESEFSGEIAREMYIIHDMDSTAKKNKYIENWFKTTEHITEGVDLTDSLEGGTQELLKRYSEIPLPVIKGPILYFFCDFRGKTSKQFACGKILPFTNSANDVEFLANLKMIRTLNLISLQFKLSSRDKSLDIGITKIERKDNAVVREVNELTYVCACRRCRDCREFLKWQDVVKQLRKIRLNHKNEMDRIRQQYHARNEATARQRELYKV